MSMVECTACRAQVPASDTAYSEQGDLLCMRCSEMQSARAQAGRARDSLRSEAAANLVFNPGLVQGVRAAVQLAQADSDYRSHMGELDQIARQPAAGASPFVRAAVASAACSRCGTPIDASQALLSDEGQPVCGGCNIANDLDAGEKRAAASIVASSGAAIVLGLIGSAFNPCLLLTFAGVAAGVGTWIQVYRHPEIARRMGAMKYVALGLATFGIGLSLVAPLIMVVVQALLFR